MANKSYIIILSIVLIIVVLFLLVWPKYQDWRELRLAVQQGKENLQREKEYFDEITTLHQKLDTHKEALVRINIALPDESSPPSIFNYLQKTAAGTGLVLKEIELAGVISSETKLGAKEIYINMSLSGDYWPDFRRFVSTIENSARIFEIEEISFSSPENPKERFSFEIKLKTYGY